MAHRVFRLVSMVWVGSLLTLGLIAAPVLFSMLDRTEAGSVAAQLFRIEAIIGVVSALVLILIGNRYVKSGIVDYRRVRWIVAMMLLCVLIGYFGLQPFMNSLRMAAQEAGTDLANSPYAKQFGVLHGISSAIYLIECLFGIALVWRLPGAAPVAIVPKNKSAKMAAKRARS
ncbi:DUF4149 domain-containing protein [Caballeronia sp. LZ035]|uniref:DUF4149 domain-containing protein n=1 Tax=Caballeronia sp. LZ035 TaxID=3038568 RepID=UPI002864F8FA|nr:DUF4149 domain-containing protein [Caballeronia sp. LZ035]MDR5757636.1 DUF4149 domain-containing protein [Caballeronia sp. LZ035]